MHIKRQAITASIPIPRKGTTYLARSMGYLKSSVPVVIAMRDMLKLARTTREVKALMPQMKINGRPVHDVRESIKLFSIFEADKPYVLSLNESGRFTFEEAKNSNIRVTKVMYKRLVKGGEVQLNLHDGTNIISKEKVAIGDSLYLDNKNAIKNHISLVKAKQVVIIKGKYRGKKGKIVSATPNHLTIQIDGGATTTLHQLHVLGL